MLAKARAWEAGILRLAFRPKMYAAGESWVGHRQRTALSLRIKWRKMDFPMWVEKIVGQHLDDHEWARRGSGHEGPFVLFWDGKPSHAQQKRMEA